MNGSDRSNEVLVPARPMNSVLPDPPARIVVISPHLDDAVLSMGAAIRRATSRGSQVTVLTVLGCDPDSSAPSGEWDRRAGFRTEGEAARGRREEDRRACALVGATPVWLPFGEAQYERHATDDEIYAAIAESLDRPACVVIPGFPLTNPDHALVARLIVERGVSSPIALYVEQPYPTLPHEQPPWKWRWKPRASEAIAHALPNPPQWRTIPMSIREHREKLRACRAYTTQIRLMTERRIKYLWRMACYEAIKGGETLGTVATRSDAGDGVSTSPLLQPSS